MYRNVTFVVALCGCETGSLSLGGHKRRVLDSRVLREISGADRGVDNRVLREISGAERDEVTGEWKKLHSEKLTKCGYKNDVKDDAMGGTCGTFGEVTYTCWILVRKSESKKNQLQVLGIVANIILK